MQPAELDLLIPKHDHGRTSRLTMRFSGYLISFPQQSCLSESQLFVLLCEIESWIPIRREPSIRLESWLQASQRVVPRLKREPFRAAMLGATAMFCFDRMRTDNQNH